LDATVEQIGQLYVLRFERNLNHPVEKVWAAITEPEQLVQWLAAAEIDPRPGGRFVLNFENTRDHMPGRVIKWDPPNLFEHTFGDEANGVVRWELIPNGDGCLLKLSHTVYSSAEMANFLSGWHTHLDLLSDLVDGRPRPWSWDEWRAHRDRYRARVSAIAQ
jgi:uncharacterized protein YndB with AHSA1/START domain